MLKFLRRSHQVIIVDDDNVRSMTLATSQRPLLLGAALAGMALASLGWIITAAALSNSRSSIFQVDQGAQALAQQLTESREQLSRVAADLDNARGALDSALAEETESRARIKAALDALVQAEKDPSRTPRQVLAAVRNELAPLRIGADEAGSHLRAAQESLQMVTDVSQDVATRRAQAAISALTLAIDGATTSPDQPPALALAGEGLAHALSEAQAQSLRWQGEAETARAERDQMAAELAGNEQKMSNVATAQVALLTRLSEHADLRIGAIEGELRDTGINLEKVLGAVDTLPRGVGGPLIGLPELPVAGLPPEARVALTQLESRLERQAKLRALKNYLPLSPPVDNFYVSSGFGSRLDPFNNQWAGHTGLDLVTREGSPVALPASGRVVAVTYDEGYGHMVEIDHGFGVHTRYAHLKKVLVKKGDMLEPGRNVGLVGDSGRASGVHLHYEVMLEGRPVDPLRFMERGRRVCEG